MIAHPTAIIHPKAEISKDAEIGPYAVIEDEVRLGPRVKVMAHAYVCRFTEIDEDSEIHMGAIVGHLPQDLSFKKKKSRLLIGKRNVVREYVTIHRGTQEGSVTEIGNDNFLMCFVHIAHNCKLGNNIVIANSSSLGGYVEVEDKAFISAYVGVHQFVRIGKLAMIGGKSRIVKDIPPYMLAKGDSLIYGMNVTGLRRASFSADARNKIKKAHKIFYKSGLTLVKAIEELEKADLGPEVKEFINFLKSNSKRSYCAHV